MASSTSADDHTSAGAARYGRSAARSTSGAAYGSVPHTRDSSRSRAPCLHTPGVSRDPHRRSRRRRRRVALT